MDFLIHFNSPSFFHMSWYIRKVFQSLHWENHFSVIILLFEMSTQNELVLLILWCNWLRNIFNSISILFQGWDTKTTYVIIVY